MTGVKDTMSKEEESFNVGAILRNKYTGATLKILKREMTETGSVGYDVQKEDRDWVDWEGTYSLNRNWEQISDPVHNYNETMRIKLVKYIQETTHQDIIMLWGNIFDEDFTHFTVPHSEEEEE